MADPQKQTPPPAPAPKAPSKLDELQKAQAELAELQAQKSLELVQAEIIKLKHGGLGPEQVRSREEAAAKRDKTLKEAGPKDEDGNPTKLAVYRLLERGYKAEKPGETHRIMEPGELVRLPLSVLPGPSLEAIKKIEAEKPAAFEAA